MTFRILLNRFFYLNNINITILHNKFGFICMFTFCEALDWDFKVTDIFFRYLLPIQAMSVAGQRDHYDGRIYIYDTVFLLN